MKFVVATDGSEESDRALDFALELARGVDASVTVVHSVAPNVYTEVGVESVRDLADADRSLVVETVEDAEVRGEEILEDAAARAADAGVDVETDLLYGDPDETVPDYAEDGGFDAVFVGHRGLSQRFESMVGSTAKDLVAYSTVPVTVVR